ncbi:branched-chain amino acid ABC transporter permease [Thermodesulfobacteriota bacterium]
MNRKKRKQEKENEINLIWIIVVICFVAALPLFVGKYVTYVANLMGIAIIVAVGLDILLGLTGQISLGHAAFIAVGAYTSTILTSKAGLPFPLALLLSGAVSALVGMMIAIPCMRLKELYLAIATMGFAFIINEIILYWRSLTNGADGMIAPRASIGSLVFDSDTKIYYLIYAVVFILVYFAYNIYSSRTGKAMISLRDSEEASESVGINVAKYKLMAFAISAFYTGVAGSLFAHTVMVISPENFTVILSIQYLVMVVVGGIGFIWGAVLGAIFITWLPELILYLKFILPETFLSNQDTQLLVYGMIMMGFMIFEPKGLYGRWLRIKAYWKVFPRSPKKLKGERTMRRWR